MILPLQSPVAYLNEIRLSVCLLGGTASQATALAKTPAFEGWTVVSSSYSVSDKPVAGVTLLDAATVQANWDANPALDLQDYDRGGALGTLPLGSLPFPKLPLTGLDPELGMQMRWRRDGRSYVCPTLQDAQSLYTAVYARRKGGSPLGRWAAAQLCVTEWGTAAVSASWPKPSP